MPKPVLTLKSLKKRTDPKIFEKHQFPKWIRPRDLQRQCHDIIEYAKTERKPVYIMHYLQPDAVIISQELWEEICDIVKQRDRFKGCVDVCQQCSLIINGF